MKTLISAILIGLAAATVAMSQTNDEVRVASGLPTPISGRSTLTPQVGVEINGMLIITGDGEPSEHPMFNVYVVSQNNNAFVFGRQRVKNKGMYKIEAVNAQQASLVFEVGGREFARYPINLISGAIVRQDVSLTWAQLNDGLKKLGVVDVRNLPLRNDKQQQLFEKGLEQRKAGKNKDAASSFGKLVKELPTDYMAYTELGNTLFDTDPSGARDAYGKALAARPEFVPALVNLGKLLIALQSNEESVTTLSKALVIDKESAETNYWLGIAYLNSRKGSKAVEHLNEALRMDPVGKADAHLRLAALYNAANLKDRAAAEYRIFLTKMPSYKDKAILEEYIKTNGK
jgi:tetratricopeptide (TPR) repeat protein